MVTRRYCLSSLEDSQQNSAENHGSGAANCQFEADILIDCSCRALQVLWIRILLSLEPEASSANPGDQAMLVIASMCPFSTRMHFQESASAHRRMLRSREPDAITLEFFHARAVTPLSWPCSCWRREKPLLVRVQMHTVLSDELQMNQIHHNFG